VGELPSETVTCLFTALEGSTRLWEEHPDAMRRALARHDELVRAAVADHVFAEDGRLVASVWQENLMRPLT